MGIEPTPSAWEAEVLPLNYSRRCTIYYILLASSCQGFYEDILKIFFVFFRAFQQALRIRILTAVFCSSPEAA